MFWFTCLKFWSEGFCGVIIFLFSLILGVTLNCICGEATILELQGMWSTPPLPLLKDLLWSIGQRELFVFDKKTMCPWCNGYRHRKWTWRQEFKSWMRLIAFHIALIPLGKVWIQLFSLQLWVNSREKVEKTGFFSFGEATSLGEGKLWCQTC